MKSVRLQLLVTFAAVLTAVSIFAARGLPPGQTLLASVKADDLHGAERSLNWGADANAVWTDETSSIPFVGAPLLMATMRSDRSMAKLLLAKGARLDVQGRGWTPLHQAACQGDNDLAALFITNGADVNGKDAAGETPLKFAVKYNHKEVADLLRQHGAKE